MTGENLEVDDPHGFIDALYEYMEKTVAGTTLERFSGRELYEVSHALDRYEREDYYPRNELALYAALREQGVPHRAIVKAYASIPRHSPEGDKRRKPIKRGR